MEKRSTDGADSLHNTKDEMWFYNFFKSMTDPAPQHYNLLSLFGMDSASDKEKDEFLKAAGEAVLTRVVERIEQKLPADKAETFHCLFETNAPDEEKADFFTAYLPDFRDILVEELQRFNREAIAQNIAHNTKKNPVDGASNMG